MNWSRYLVIFLFIFPILTSAQPEQTDLAQYVNPLVGTDSDFKLSNGNTYPAIALPWGMNFWTPWTGPMGDGWQYSYDAVKIRGFKQTHQPSPWINDYAAFALMPLTGQLKIDQDERASWFSHKRETVHPYEYKVYLGDYDVWVELAPTERAACFRFTFPQTDSAYILVDGFFKGSSVTVLPDENKVVGYCRNNSGGVPENFKNYFVVQFDKRFAQVLTWRDSTLSTASGSTGEHVGAVLRFVTNNGERIEARVASSFISPEQAQLNLDREIGEQSYDNLRDQAHHAWNRELERFQVTGGSEGYRINFYTALYRTLLFPRKFYEINARNVIVHYSPYNGEVLPGYMFTDNGFWDTFRAVFPFFTLFYPELNSHIMQGLVNAYKESGWLPEWASPGHRDCMIGSNSASIIADSYLKGIRGYDIDMLYQAILRNSEHAGPFSSVGRLGVGFYNDLGYIPYNVGINENVARTLEYSYDDFCIWKLARALHRPQEEIVRFRKRAGNYVNVFDQTVNFMRGKNVNGSWQRPFNPAKWGDAFTEGSAWHYTWSVFHDPQGLIDLMGGKAAFIDKLDSVFTSPPVFDCTYYGFPIHEITEMVIAGMGQYAHGNQPIQHGTYLYNYAGAPWKTQQHVREIMKILYTPTPDGLCGDEDNGQTSAWFVFSAMGFYPVCPGTDQYVLGSPLFEKIELQLENGNRFVIDADHNNDRNIYIQHAVLNGNEYTRNYLSHKAIENGGEFILEMGPEPNMQRGTSDNDLPYSMSVK